MALVEIPLGVAMFSNGASTFTATVLVDETDIDPTGDPVFDATFEGPITVIVVGPGAFRVDIWRTPYQDGNAVWRSSESQFPGGITDGDAPADDPLLINTGGPVQSLDDVVWNIQARGQ